MSKQILFNICKAPFMGKFIGIVFQYFSWAIPVKKVYSSKEVIAFCHPKPSYKNHVVIVPKRAVANLQQLMEECFCEYFIRIWEAANAICATHPEYQDSFVLVANGGKRQEVKQVHFHMFTNQDIVNAEWEIYKMIPTTSELQLSKEYIQQILQSIELLDKELDIVQKGYSLVYQYEKQRSNVDIPTFYIVAGKKGEISK